MSFISLERNGIGPVGNRILQGPPETIAQLPEDATSTTVQTLDGKHEVTVDFHLTDRMFPQVDIYTKHEDLVGQHRKQRRRRLRRVQLDSDGRGFADIDKNGARIVFDLDRKITIEERNAFRNKRRSKLSETPLSHLPY